MSDKEKQLKEEELENVSGGIALINKKAIATPEKTGLIIAGTEESDNITQTGMVAGPPP